MSEVSTITLFVFPCSKFKYLLHRILRNTCLNYAVWYLSKIQGKYHHIFMSGTKKTKKINAWLFFYDLQWVNKLPLYMNFLSVKLKIKIEVRKHLRAFKESFWHRRATLSHSLKYVADFIYLIKRSAFPCGIFGIPWEW